MKILAIETSCDETSASVVEKKDNSIEVLSNITLSSLPIHAKTGGIIPENAAREQVKFIIPVICEALLSSKEIKNKKDKKQILTLSNKILQEEIDAIAVTCGPGLIGSLLVGVETAKTLSFIFNKPIIPVNHLLAHLYANFIDIDQSNLSLRSRSANWRRERNNLDGIATSFDKLRTRNDKLDAGRYPLGAPSFPFIGLIASGGHTDLLYFKSHTNFKWLGGTRDDAAGEAMDKIARIIGLGYPGGPEIEKRAKFGKPDERFVFKSPMIGSDDFDFSFSGLKTQVMRAIQKHLRGGAPTGDDSSNGGIDENSINNICFLVQKAIVDVLIKKTIRAAKLYNVSTIVLGGGVSANETLRRQLSQKTKDKRLKTKIFFPEKKFCTDNAAMVGAYALLAGNSTSWKKIKAQPELYFD